MASPTSGTLRRLAQQTFDRAAWVKLCNSDAWSRAAGKPGVQALVAIAFILYLTNLLTRFRLADVWPIKPTGDLAIVFIAVRNIFEHGRYPEFVFPYSPSSVVLIRAFELGGPTFFTLAWYVAAVSGLIISVRAALSQERAEVRAAWPLIGMAAVLLSDSAIRWDLRNSNNNLIYLGLVMASYGCARRWPLLAGSLAAVSGSYKLYSGLLIAWLLANGQRRMLYASIICGIALWAGLPLVLFGIDGTVALYLDWKQQVERIGDLAFHANLMVERSAVPIVSLRRAFVNLTGEGFQSARVEVLLWLTRALWIAVLAWYAWRCRRGFFADLPSRAALADWIVLLIAPLPFSPWLEPYHAIPLLVAAVLCTTIALDGCAENRDRWAALTALVVLALFLLIRVPFPVRGLGLLAQFIAIVAVLGFLRPRLPRWPVTDGQPAQPLRTA